MGVEYDGTSFHGWQLQDNLATVQQQLERAVGYVADHPVRVHCAGRTDRGVHGLGQVIHFDTSACRSMRSWMLGSNISSVGWPQCGEIDIMEYRGQQPSVILGTLHGPGYSGGQGISQHRSISPAGFHEDFHVFGVEWDSGGIRWTLDGELYHRVNRDQVPGPWVFDQPFQIILNVAVGGNFIGPPNATTEFPQTMTVDWVRVYQER